MFSRLETDKRDAASAWIVGHKDTKKGHLWQFIPTEEEMVFKIVMADDSYG